MLQRDIAMLESPSPRVLAALREWLHGPSRASNRSSKLDGRDKDMFSVGSDLVALRPPADTDPLSKLLRNHWPFPSEVRMSLVPFAIFVLTDSTQRLSPHEWDRFRHFKDRRLSWVVTSLSIAIATFLLVVPIIVLYFVTNPNARLALTITFIIAFAIGLSATTSANRDAIFAATAAYSAVLVVFVSGDLANAK